LSFFYRILFLQYVAGKVFDSLFAIGRWERRAPLAPRHVAELVRRGLSVLVQPSTLRTFSDKKYEEAGAIIREDLSEADLILGVKQVPPESFIPNKTYMFFAHIIKAQPENMKMLDAMLEKNIRLLDYEKITDKDGKRLVRFGKFAGYAGMIDMLHGLGDRLLALGYSTPFLHIGYSYCYPTLETAKQAVLMMGEEINSVGLPKPFLPMTFAFTSQGNVSQGAQEMFNLLPHKWVSPDEMVEIVKNQSDANPNLIYATVIESKHYIVPKNPNAVFDKEDYYKNPDKYTSVFHEKYLPYISVIINCQYWDMKYPRLITFEQMKKLVEAKRSRLIGVADLACDLNGAIEFLVQTTSIDNPLFVYDPKTYQAYDSQTDKNYMYKEGILFLAVDNLPTEFPREATNWFGDCLLPFVEPVARAPFHLSYEELGEVLPPEVYKSVLLLHGQLAPPYRYIAEWRRRNEEQNQRKILILGAGFVAKPCVKYLRRIPSHIVTVVDAVLERAQRAAGNKQNTRAVALDVNENPAALEKFISTHDLVVSLLPTQFNVDIAKFCIKHKKNLITANYISAEMRALHEEAKAAGVVLLNECGLDPGIDHMAAMQLINEVKEKDGEITAFVSWCGGLPAPESSGNPLGYKFSWSPKGMLIASIQNAHYRILGNEVTIPGNQLFKHVQPVSLFPAFALEGIPNRNALIYAEEYKIQNAETVFRGTLRYKGFSEIMEALVDIGLLSEKKVDYLLPSAPKLTWNEFMTKILAQDSQTVKTIEQNKNAKEMLSKKLLTPPGFPSKGYDSDKVRRIIESFEWLGLFSFEEVDRLGTPMDCLCAQLQKKLSFEKGDRDVVILHHIFGIKWKDGKKMITLINVQETRTSTLVCYGEPDGPTAMSLTVGLPVAIAAELLVKGDLKTTPGVTGPTKPEIYNPILAALSDEGIAFVTKIYPEN